MRVPGFLLRDNAIVEPYIGTGFGGVIEYGDPVEEKCHIEPGRVVVTDREGQEVVAEATAFFFPHVDLPPQSRVTWNRRQYEVIESRPMRALGKTHHVEVVMR